MASYSGMLVLLMGVALRAQDAPVNVQDVPPILKIGAEAPDFNLPGIDGKLHSLKEYRSSKVLAIVFTSNHCPVAQMYEQRIEKLVSDFSSRGVAVVAAVPPPGWKARPAQRGLLLARRDRFTHRVFRRRRAWPR